MLVNHHPSCSAGPSTFFAGWPTFSAIPWIPLCAKCVRATEEKRVIGVQPVRARCGCRLCLTQRQTVDPNNDTSRLDLTAAASVPFTGLSKLDELTSPVTKATTLDYPFPSPTTPTTCNSTHLFATVCKSDKVSYLVDSTRPSGVLTEFGFYVRDVEVAGSNPVAPTFYKPSRIMNL